MDTASMPTRISLRISKEMPQSAVFTVEVCNNAYDVSPTWEDATSTVNGNLSYVFTNTKKTADRWGVSIRVMIDRNGGSGACYINEIGGNFE